MLWSWLSLPDQILIPKSICNSFEHSPRTISLPSYNYYAWKWWLHKVLLILLKMMNHSFYHMSCSVGKISGIILNIMIPRFRINYVKRVFLYPRQLPDLICSTLDQNNIEYYWSAYFLCRLLNGYFYELMFTLKVTFIRNNN